MQKVSEGTQKFRYTVTSQINFIECAENKTNVGWSEGMPRKFLQNHSKNTRFRAFCKQLLAMLLRDLLKE